MQIPFLISVAAAGSGTSMAEVVAYLEANNYTRAQIDAVIAALQSQDATLQTNIDAKVPRAELGVADGVATLDSEGRLKIAQLPELAVVDYLGDTADQAAMLGIPAARVAAELPPAEKGDWTIRIDRSTVWIIIGDDPTQLSSWKEMAYPTGGAMTSGTIDGVTIGETTPSTGAFTAVTVGGNVFLGTASNQILNFAKNNVQFLSGATHDGTAFIARAATPARMRANSAGFTFSVDSGLTIGDSFNPTDVAFVTETGINNTPVGATTPSTGAFTTLRVVNGTLSGAPTWLESDRVLVESASGTANVQIYSPAASDGGVRFSRPGVRTAGGIYYEHPSDTLNFQANGAPVRARISETGLTVFGNLSVSGTTINAASLPTSSAGLNAGDLWVDTAAGNVVKRA